MGCREGVVGVEYNRVVARHCRFRVTGDGGVENGIKVSGRAGLDPEPDMIESAQNDVLLN
jgi:hypothetical protein